MNRRQQEAEACVFEYILLTEHPFKCLGPNCLKQMGNSNSSLLDDLKRANEESTLHFWAGISTALISFVLPILGLIAAYSGYQLTKIMNRKWFGWIVVAFGLGNFVLWIITLVFLI